MKPPRCWSCCVVLVVAAALFKAVVMRCMEVEGAEDETRTARYTYLTSTIALAE